MALKQQTCSPPSYPARSSVGLATDWDAPGYLPVYYEMPLLDKVGDELPDWADDKTCTSEEVAKRLTHCGGGEETTVDKICSYDAVCARYRNPKGKTGICGRGMLGRYGPNHAADCIVTRFHPLTNKPQAIVVDRVDGDKSSIAWPAGMVEPGEEVPEVLEREMKEEAVVESQAVDRLFKECRRGVVYRGHVDDQRNTDHAWMETTVVHFHASDDIAGAIEFGTKDTHEVKTSYWVDMDSISEMYASHYEWLCIVRERLDDGMRQKDIHKQFHNDDWMVDGEKLSQEEIAVAIQWRKFDKDALTKRLCLMLAQGGEFDKDVLTKRLGLMLAQAGVHNIVEDEDDDARECADMVRECKRARTTSAS